MEGDEKLTACHLKKCSGRSAVSALLPFVCALHRHHLPVPIPPLSTPKSPTLALSLASDFMVSFTVNLIFSTSRCPVEQTQSISDALLHKPRPAAVG